VFESRQGHSKDNAFFIEENMTSPDTESTVADRAQTFLDWTKINQKLLSVGAVLVVVAAAGFWFYQRSQQLQANAAERALLQAKQSMSAGNLQLAQTDLQRVYSRYGKTAAGVQAGMLLSQIDYDTGKFQDGVNRLKQLAGTSAASGHEPTILSLEGDGYAQMGKLAEAAQAYQRAAEASDFENEKAFQRSKAARAYQAAGDTAKAREAWTALLNDPTAMTTAAEARIRLGEISAHTAK
jgi:predicted negative regulator of RcsB-dependent stress response